MTHCCTVPEETYETIMARARRLGISSPGELATYALDLFAQIVDELDAGSLLLVQRDHRVQELVLQAAAAGNRPLLKVALPVSELPTLRLTRR